MQITGAVLRQALERSAEYFTRNDDGTLRVSDCFLEPKVEHYNYDYYAGVSYAYDISQPVGQRVIRMTVAGKPVAPDDVFTICLNSYRASGTGGYDCYVGCPMVREIGTEMSDLILEYDVYKRQVLNDVRNARQNGHKIVTFTKRSDSTLAQMSDIVFVVDGSRQTLAGSLPNTFFGQDVYKRQQ